MTAKKKGALKREADYKAVESIAELRLVLKALCERVDWLEGSLKPPRLHQTQDVRALLTCQEFVRKG